MDTTLPERGRRGRIGDEGAATYTPDVIRRGRARAFYVATVSTATLLAACTSSATVSPTSTVTSTPSTVAQRADDGVLRIGVLLPESGVGAPIGVSELAAVHVAVDRANAAGGVLGQKVQLIIRNEGVDAVAAGVGLQQLIESQIDVLIGPANSNTAIALAPAIVQAGIAACSPSASALALDDFPDNGLLFRTIASDSLQAEAMAEVIEQTGETSAAITYVDDGYGRPFEKALERALRQRGIKVDAAVGFSVDNSKFSKEAVRAVKSGNGAIALIGDPDAGSRVLAALADAMGGAPRDIVVNDALRKPFSISLLAAIAPNTRARIVGVSPYVRTDDKDLLASVTSQDSNASGLFATQAFDCANVFMIAAEQTGSTQADAIKTAIPGISTAGSSCASFSECRALVAQHRRIKYDGPSGRLVLGASGDVSSALFDEFDFDPSGRDTSVRQLEVGQRG